MKRSPLQPGAKSLQRGSTFAADPKPLKRAASGGRRKPISPAHPSQREKVAGARCVVCLDSPCDPAHTVPRSMGGGDDPLDVVPLCRRHHRLFDDGKLSLLEHLEPHWRDEVAQAVRRVGLVSALQVLTNQRWAPEREAA